MIIVKLFGGLGNQMFQYALGSVISKKYGVSLKLDISEYRDSTFRKYCLKHFKIKAEVATYFDIIRFAPLAGIKIFLKNQNNIIGKILNKIILKFNLSDNRYLPRYYSYCPESKSEPLMIGRVVSQRFFHFDPEVQSVPDNILLYGSWISYKYFDHLKVIIQDELTVKYPMNYKNKEMSNYIKNCNSVSVHIRRTDKCTDNLHNSTSLDYCYRAIKLINSKINQPSFFIFSDDIKWVKNNFKCNKRFTIVDINDDDKNYQDLRLMSMCKHNIIAESSFSWWGAYLNRNSDKIVISPDPKLWINLNNFKTHDILPPSWIVLY